MASRNQFALSLAFLCSVAICSSASASLHLMQIEQVIGGVNGDPTQQAIQLRMRSAGQNLVSQGRIRAWDAAGANPVVIIDMTTDVPNGAAGARVLITSASFNSSTSPVAVPNFTMTNLIPPSYMAAGSLTFEDDSGTLVYWRLSWGGANYTGSCIGTFDNDGNGNFCPAWSTPLPSETMAALKFQGAALAGSTTNAADYAVTPGASAWFNNAGTAFTLSGPVVGACCLGDTCIASQSQSDCINMKGAYQGDNSACFGNTCVLAIGACCNPDGSCADGISIQACEISGGQFQGEGTTCDSSKCATPCAGDVTGNGLVDVDDLLALINSWGACPSCPADINDNGVVDVDDLLALINDWSCSQ